MLIPYHIDVRQLRFELDEINPVWSSSSPEFSIFINALGLHVPYFERVLVEVMRQYRGVLDDAQLVQDVQSIIGQEAHHAFNFVAWNKQLCARYPGLQRLENSAKTYFEKHKGSSKQFRIGFVAGYETFTFLGGMIILNRFSELMANADPTLRALWVWHQVEEVEHGAVAFEFYQAFYPQNEWYRRWMIVSAFTHIATETLRAYHIMIKGEGYYGSWRRALKAWRFFASFASDLAIAALPVLKKRYHPRLHPICNDEQNQVALAWRKHHKNGYNVLSLDNSAIQQMLSSSPT